MGRTQYLAVHVYRGKSRWMLNVAVKETGSPWPRTVRVVYDGALEEDSPYLPQAAQAAAGALLAAFPRGPAAPAE